MGMEHGFLKERLVMGVLSSDSQIEACTVARLVERYGALCFRSASEPFHWTDYYCPEMGNDIRRFYIAFERLVDPGELATIKRVTNAIEREMAVDGRRRVNLDPGMLGTARFCLATTKDRSHRIPLSNGIYAELTLIYERKEFRPLPWTYPD
ncbi:MAG: DUF4416 family protein, partial [Rectinema sp.]|nr:DUF4416 family protein [Rectinema sp.]